jgi:hypothetical protein
MTVQSQTIQFIPLNKLIVSPRNVRRKNRKADIDALAHRTGAGWRLEDDLLGKLRSLEQHAAFEAAVGHVRRRGDLRPLLAAVQNSPVIGELIHFGPADDLGETFSLSWKMALARCAMRGSNAPTISPDWLMPREARSSRLTLSTFGSGHRTKRWRGSPAEPEANTRPSIIRSRSLALVKAY